MVSDVIDLGEVFQEIADEAAAAEAREHASAVATEDAVAVAVASERNRCSYVVQEAISQAHLRGLPEQSPVVRVLSAIRQVIDVG